MQPATGRELVGARLRSAVADGATVLLATHAVDLARKLADRVVVLEEGAAAWSGAAVAVLAAWSRRRLGAFH